jgi:hypothetical protein
VPVAEDIKAIVVHFLVIRQGGRAQGRRKSTGRKLPFSSHSSAYITVI